MNSSTRLAIEAGPHARNTGQTIVVAVSSACLALVIVAYAFSRPLEDFVAYWTAGHLLVAHHNPYSLAEVYRMQQPLGWREPIPLMALNPPWTLPFIAPLGLAKSYAWAWLGWVAILTASVAWASLLLMDIYFGDLSIPEISDKAVYRCLFAFTFYPVLLSLKFAQTAPILLLAVAGFLYFESKRKPILAGVLFSLTAVKPHLVYLVWLALFIRSCQQRWWKVLASAAGVVALLTAIALMLDPQALRQYWELASGPLPKVLLPGIPGLVRRLLGARDTWWLQPMTPIIGVVWFVFYWRRHRAGWSWIEHMPALITASMLTTGWGYLFDQNLLAVPIIALAAKHAKELGRLPRNLVILYTALNIALILAAMSSTPWSFVPAPVLIAVLLFRDSRARPRISSDVLVPVMLGSQ